MAILTRLTGGLGNQIFQAAAGYALARRIGCDLYLNATHYSSKKKRRFELDNFEINEDNKVFVNRRRTFLSKSFNKFRFRDFERFTESSFAYDPRFETLGNNTEIHGYMQSEQYFSNYRDDVRKLFMPRAKLGPKTTALLTGHVYSVLHVRRGDYLDPSNTSIFAFPGLDYYKEAIDILHPDIPIIVVSDDLEWVRDNLKTDREIYFPGLEEPASGIQDLTIMANAKHHIIANSSFSWWGAWLGEKEDSVIIAPSVWFMDEIVNTRDLIPDRWTKI